MIKKWFETAFSKASDHPMGDFSEAKKLLAEIPSDEPIKAMDEINSWLFSLRDAQGFSLSHRVSVIHLLLEKAWPFQQQLSKLYLPNKSGAVSAETKIWSAIFEFWKQTALNYGVCIQQYKEGGKAAQTIENEVTLIWVRIARALTEQVKWLYIKYRNVDKQIWTDIGLLYASCESLDFLRKPVKLMPEDAHDTCVLHEILKALTFTVSSPGNLRPAEMILAYRIIEKYAGNFTWEEIPNQDSTFCFDPLAAKPPSRLIKGMQIHNLTRFFGSGLAEQALSDLTRAVGQGQLNELDMGGRFDQEAIARVIRHITTNWSKVQPQRAYRRIKQNSALQVVQGFLQLRKVIGGESDQEDAATITSVKVEQDILYHERLDMKLYGFVTEKTKKIIAEEMQKKAQPPKKKEIPSENWIMEDISEGGVCATFPQYSAEWVKIGALLGVKAVDSEIWNIGLIRRLSRDAESKQHVGIEIMSHKPVAVDLLALVETPTGWAAAPKDAEGSLLAGLLIESVGNRAENLLLPLGNFSADGYYQLLGCDFEKVIKLTRTLERGEDFCLMQFEEASLT